MSRTGVIALALGITLGVAWLWQRQARPQTDSWPRQPVRIIVPFGSGGSLDLTARLLGEQLAKIWKQPVVVENRPGGDSSIGIGAFTQSRDEHTLLFTPSAAVTYLPQVHENLPYDPVHDLVPISTATEPTIVIAASSSCPARSLEELCQLAREKPDEYIWTGIPGAPDLIFSAFVAAEELRMKRIAYHEIAMALQDFAQGRIHIITSALATVQPHVNSGRARLLAVATTQRAPGAPDVPTLGEAGHGDLSIDGSFGFYGRRGMPEAMANRIAADVRRVLGDPALADRLRSMGQNPRGCTPEEFSAIHERQRHQIRSILQSLGRVAAPP